MGRRLIYPVRIDAPNTSTRRPAHRPSRRNAVVDGAMTLFASFPVDEVTVHDIAGAVGMTPAAVYYHFASKEQILAEGLQRFTDELIEEVRTNLPGAGEANGIPELVSHIVGWARRNRSQAAVYFVNSVGLNPLIEARRRSTRIELIELFQQAVRSVHGKVRPAQAAVIGVALVSLVETSIAANLSQDQVYKGLGARRFTQEVEALAARISSAAA